MDSIEVLEESARGLIIAKYLSASAITLTLYDHLLSLDDEIRYIWKGRKAWVSYLYILNRILLTGYQFLEICYISSPRKSKTACLAEYYAKVFLVPFFLLSSDTFIALRIYAITSKNKILAAYFGTLALARITIPVAISFAKPPVFVDLPLIPVDAFNMCAASVNLEFMLIPDSIATGFELSAFLVIVWYTYRNKSMLKFSALVRTIITEATIYFLAMIILQTYIQLALGFMKGITQQLSFLAYGTINPVLSMRFAVSLRRSADLNGGHELQLNHVSSADPTYGPPPDTQVSAVQEYIELDLFDPLNDQRQTHGP